MRIGMIGLGVIGNRHLKNLVTHADVEIVALCGNQEQKTANIAREYGAVPYTDYMKMFECEQLDAVFICTPPGVRKQPVAEAAARGIACFIEKPPAKTSEEASEISDLIRSSGIIHSVGFMYRYTGAVIQAKKLIDATDSPVSLVRSILVCGAALPGSTTPRWLFNKSLSGGPLFDQAIHLLDAARYVVGTNAGDVQDIHAFGSNMHTLKNDDFTVEEHHVVNVAYGAGTLQTHTHSWAIAEFQSKIELLSHDYRLLIDLSKLGSRLEGTYRGEPISLHFADENMYADETSVFLEAVRTNNQTIIRSPYADAAKSLALVLAANESVATRKSLQLQ